MKRIYLRTTGGHYPILIGRGLIRSLSSLFKRLNLGQKVLVVTNRAVSRLHLKSVIDVLSRGGFQVSYFLTRYGDERDKSERTLYDVWKVMAEIPLERNSTLVALGGGVVGDLAGFAASTYMRGISVVQIPTTLLAQVDSAIGGKTAIDLPSAKNMVGTFHQPRLVVSDIDILATLDAQMLRNSFAEVIKYGVIRDPELFTLLEKKALDFFAAYKKGKLNSEQRAFLENVVWRSSKVKAKVVERDDRETKGERMILNYGHTLGHAVEAAGNFRMPHGKAVAIGMTFAARLARVDGVFSSRAEARQNELLKQVGLPTNLKNVRASSRQLISYMKRDKKVKNGRLRFVLPRSIGRVEVRDNVSEKKVKSVLDAW